MNQPWSYTYSPSWSSLPPPHLPDPSESSQCTRPEHLSHASNLGCWSVSPYIVYMFWCCSLILINFYCSCSVTKLCQTLCDLMSAACQTSLPFTISQSLLKLTSIDWINDAIQPSPSLLPPSLPAFNLSQHHGIFQWVSSSHQVAIVLELQLQYQSFQWILKIDYFKDWLV